MSLRHGNHESPGDDPLKSFSKRDVLIVASLVLAVGMAVWQGHELRADRADLSRRSAAIHTAEAQVIDLTTIDSATVRQKLKLLSKRTEGEFRTQLDGITASFVKIIGENNVRASGTIDSAAVARFNRNEATVIIASTAHVSNKAQRDPTIRTYRMSVDLRWRNDHWLVTGMEFVA
ncbi:MAG: hypothetical protein ACJ71Z_08280 [Aeromicrobium sp.]